MSTRANILVIDKFGRKYNIYHHHDGYLSGVGLDLYRRLRELKNISAEGFVNRLVKDPDDEYDITFGVHGDEEFFYEIDYLNHTLTAARAMTYSGDDKINAKKVFSCDFAETDAEKIESYERELSKN